MSRYSGYEGRNVYREEFWYPALTVPEFLVVNTIGGAAAVLIPYVPVAVLDPLLQLAQWDGDDFRGRCWRTFMGLKEVEVIIDNNPVPVYEYSILFAANLLIYQLDERSNQFVDIIKQYPNSPIPFRWRSNKWVYPLG